MVAGNGIRTTPPHTPVPRIHMPTHLGLRNGGMTTYAGALLLLFVRLRGGFCLLIHGGRALCRNPPVARARLICCFSLRVCARVFSNLSQLLIRLRCFFLLFVCLIFLFLFFCVICFLFLCCGYIRCCYIGLGLRGSVGGVGCLGVWCAWPLFLGASADLAIRVEMEVCVAGV